MFVLAVAAIGHMLERSLRRSHLDEYLIQNERRGLQLKRLQFEMLLQSMLPAKVIERFRDQQLQLESGVTPSSEADTASQGRIAEDYHEVTVLFCQICNFDRFADETTGQPTKVCHHRQADVLGWPEPQRRGGPRVERNEL